MTQEQFDKAVEVNEKLHAFSDLMDELDERDVKLAYVHRTGIDGCKECDHQYDWSVEEALKEILERHDKMIREEICKLKESLLSEIPKI